MAPVLMARKLKRPSMFRGTCLTFPQPTETPMSKITVRIPETLKSRMDALTRIMDITQGDAITEALTQWCDAQMDDEDRALLILKMRSLQRDIEALNKNGKES